MRKYTLLEMVQAILSNTDGEEVNSYSDTTESRQIAEIIRQTYFNLASFFDFEEHKNVIQLVASGSNLKPTLMTLPTDCASLEWLKYNKLQSGDTEPAWDYVNYIPLDRFLEMMPQNTDDDDVGSMTLTIGGKSYVFNYHNTRAPEWYTTLDEDTLIFDSYDAEVDSTLTAAKTLGFGLVTPTFTMSDSFTPALDHKQFSLLLSEAEAEVWAKLHRIENGRSERRARRNWVSTQRTKQRVDTPSRYPNHQHLKHVNYGR